MSLNFLPLGEEKCLFQTVELLPGLFEFKLLTSFIVIQSFHSLELQHKIKECTEKVKDSFNFLLAC